MSSPELVQGSPEWLAMRKKYIGASDSPAIMGVGFKTPFQLWQEKLDLVPPTVKTPSMQRGLELEDQARQELERMTGLFFLPQVKFHATIPYMMASLDGVDPEEKVVAEIKCPNTKDHSIALDGKIPEKYFPQLQHQLEVCQVEMGYYFSFDGTAGALVKIYRDDQYIKKMLKKEQEFWECMQEFTPPELTDKDYTHKTSMEWVLAATDWLATHKRIKALETEEEALRAKLVALAGTKNSMGSGVRLSRTIRKGAIDYKAIPELKEINLENYRKKHIEFYQITPM